MYLAFTLLIKGNTHVFTIGVILLKTVALNTVEFFSIKSKIEALCENLYNQSEKKIYIYI